ncbi:class I SAM-dependent methyltransferase [Sphingomonas sp. BAUL-RG-20F-R05-02]|uniref:class I SAM-dependent methyltransferase n=1 Tax=Sphingomonas sp. BAUL-RG-20F-R05-02 TaxID=2914830 RepID=UPI001F5AB71F|nr:methyltransferase domain-containing protein [Sphingomonas sp. BAUL-RG-20F-R05-02]
MSNLAGLLPPGAFDKQDQESDLAFYAPPRLVTHIDDAAVAALMSYYTEVIPDRAVVLDLMSSWVSHLPDNLPTSKVIGHGMNALELAANPRLDRWFVADLNAEPVLPLMDAAIDVALCCVGVQYLQHPVEVFSEVRRALTPGGVFAVSFSNRCFPTKAIRIWQSIDMAGKVELVQLYMKHAGFYSSETAVLADGSTGDPMVVVAGRTVATRRDGELQA